MTIGMGAKSIAALHMMSAFCSCSQNYSTLWTVTGTLPVFLPSKRTHGAYAVSQVHVVEACQTLLKLEVKVAIAWHLFCGCAMQHAFEMRMHHIIIHWCIDWCIECIHTMHQLKESCNHWGRLYQIRTSCVSHQPNNKGKTRAHVVVYKAICLNNGCYSQASTISWSCMESCCWCSYNNIATYTTTCLCSDHACIHVALNKAKMNISSCINILNLHNKLPAWQPA